MGPTHRSSGPANGGSVVLLCTRERGPFAGRSPQTLGLPLHAKAQSLTFELSPARRQAWRSGSGSSRHGWPAGGVKEQVAVASGSCRGKAAEAAFSEGGLASHSCPSTSGLSVRWRSAKWRGVLARARRMLRLQETQRSAQSFAAQAQAVASGRWLAWGSSERLVRLVAVSVCAG